MHPIQCEATVALMVKRVLLPVARIVAVPTVGLAGRLKLSKMWVDVATRARLAVDLAKSVLRWLVVALVTRDVLVGAGQFVTSPQSV